MRFGDKLTSDVTGGKLESKSKFNSLKHGECWQLRYGFDAHLCNYSKKS